jgi:hypothetical protein
MLSGGPTRTVIAKTSSGPMGYGSPALITEHATHELMSPQAGTSTSGYDTGSITETIMSL